MCLHMNFNIIKDKEVFKYDLKRKVDGRLQGGDESQR